MPFNDPALHLRDMIECINLIENFTDGMNLNVFRDDLRTVAAVERKLQKISEAAVRLGDDAEKLCPEPPWRDIRGIGNWLRHQYDKVDVETVWNTVQNDLPPLKASILRALNL